MFFRLQLEVEKKLFEAMKVIEPRFERGNSITMDGNELPGYGKFGRGIVQSTTELLCFEYSVNKINTSNAFAR